MNHKTLTTYIILKLAKSYATSLIQEEIQELTSLEDLPPEDEEIQELLSILQDIKDASTPSEVFFQLEEYQGQYQGEVHKQFLESFLE